MDGFGLENRFATYLILEVQVTFWAREKDSIWQQKCTSHLTDLSETWLSNAVAQSITHMAIRLEHVMTFSWIQRNFITKAHLYEGLKLNTKTKQTALKDPTK